MGRDKVRRMLPGNRFLLWMDMEGISSITDYREILPVHEEYWRVGRSRFTSDAGAAAKGMLRAGANEVVVLDGHGLGWPNLLEEQLPAGARPFMGGDRFDGFDGMVLVGFHARCGTPNGFMSHTFVPYLRVKVNGSLATECHVWGLRAGIPVLGIVGDEALGDELDGFLVGTPFLGVKVSSTRTETHPKESTPERSAEVIAQFAETCVRERQDREAPRSPQSFEVAVSMPENLTRFAEGQSGLARKSKGVLTMRTNSWKPFADSALDASMGAAAGPLFSTLNGLDLSSSTGLNRADPRQLNQARKYFADWASSDSPAWED